LTDFRTVTRPELLEDGDDHRFRALIYDILAFSTRLDAVRNGLGALMGLAGPQYSVLITVKMLEETGNTGISDVADYLHVSGAFVTSEVNKLLKQGLVTKVVNANDRRRVSLSLTDEARQRLQKLSEYQRPINDILFAGVARDEFFVLSSVLPRLVTDGDNALLEIDYLLKRRNSLAG